MPAILYIPLILVGGMLVGVLASFSGLGGGIIMVPALIFAGFTAQKAAGTSLFAILIICFSAIFAHGRYGNIDWRTGLLLGAGGIIGAQLGAYLLQHLSSDLFRKVFALLLIGFAVYLFFKK